MTAHQILIKAVSSLKERDTQLAKIIDAVGSCRLERGAQGFIALVYSIIGQQLSNSSAKAIRSRFDALFDDNINPQLLMEIGYEELRRVGMSRMKAECLQSLAEHVLAGDINFSELEGMGDEEIIKALTQIKGVGRWTAEMYLIFSLGRLDIFPIDDLSIRTSMARVYNMTGGSLKSQAEMIAGKWRPYRTVASWYLYRYLDLLRANRK